MLRTQEEGALWQSSNQGPVSWADLLKQFGAAQGGAGFGGAGMVAIRGGSKVLVVEVAAGVPVVTNSARFVMPFRR